MELDWKSEKIGVLYGGVSSEREISLISGKCVFDALKQKGLHVHLIDAKDDYITICKKESIHQVFIALHGKHGEDGEVQSILEKNSILYTGSGPSACDLAMNKVKSRVVFQKEGILCPKWQAFSNQKEALAHELSYPLFVKPASGGSSIGVFRVDHHKGLASAIAEAMKEDNEVICEEVIEGREMAVGVLGEHVFFPIEIKTSHLFYDFEAKYKSNDTQYIFPEDLSAKEIQEIKHVAWRTHQSLGCEGFSRVDLFWTADGAYPLEVNAIPGLTPKSLLPKQAAREGVSFEDLCVMILKESSCQKSEKRI